jgi:hypothetical protein
MRSTKDRALWPGSGGRRRNGAMIEDWLMWDNQSLMKQIASAPWTRTA